MLVKHNYYPNYKVEIKASESRTNHVKFIFNDMNLIDGKNYTLSFYTKQSANGSGQFTIYFIQDNYKTFSRNIWNNANEKTVFKFKYERSRTPIAHIYSDVDLKTAGVSNMLYMIKLEEGDVPNLYVPSKASLPKDKQPLLPPEGQYKEIRPNN
ncbi:hypothetical protein [Anaerococcus tetradius]|uniref:Uncharacterized protein n=1 Tax=Anaerococcus tetradius TaxID=33036 RepID=A0A133KDL4_9FIRM|nr:hypothetical protein [Anaerococcus tetradius]KWZ77564.1 hypothetical protein HMPREF3200_01385 [Anaerococcus tetradius]